MKGIRVFVLGMIGFLPLAAVGAAPLSAEATAPVGELAAGAESAAGTLSAAVDLRPSWAVEKDTFHTENEASVKWALTRGFSLAWVQEFHTNLSSTITQGLDFRLAD